MNKIWIDEFINKINSLEKNNIRNILLDIYTDDVLFIDPVKTLRGLEELTEYFENLYKSVNKCHFTIEKYRPNGVCHSLQWVMHLEHAKISRNREIIIEGASFIEFKDNKVCYHRDYYDLGALVYEHIPVLGPIISKVRHAI